MKKVLILIVIFPLFISCTKCSTKDDKSDSIATRPNIILILADDMGYSDLGCMGSEIETPNLDRLANEGVLFTNCYNLAKCGPSRASLLTGIYYNRAVTGVPESLKEENEETIAKIWKDEGYPLYLKEDALTIAEVFRDNEYTTLMIGKWHHGNFEGTRPMDRGFDRYYGIPGGGVYFYPSRFFPERHLFLDGNRATPELDWYSTDGFTDYAIDFIKEASDKSKPFFLHLSYIAPHYPLQARESDVAKYYGKYDQGYNAIREERFNKQQVLGIISENVTISPSDSPDWEQVADKIKEARKMEIYAAQVDCLDRNIGRLMKNLQDLGILDNTLIIFLSDNGGDGSDQLRCSANIRPGGPDSFYSYGKPWANVSNTPYRMYKKYSHEGGIITPLIMFYPKKLKKMGVKVTQPIHIIDVMPTCLEMAGIEFPLTLNGISPIKMDGESFVGLAEGNIQFNDRELFWNFQGNSAIRQGDYKLVKKAGNDWELYNLKNDPTELNDLSQANPELTSSLKTKYDAWSSR